MLAEFESLSPSLMHPTPSASLWRETVNSVIVLSVWRPVFLVKQKGPSVAERGLQCCATIQPSCRQCGCPHTAAPPTPLAMADNMKKRADARDPAGPERGAEQCGWGRTTGTRLQPCFYTGLEMILFDLKLECVLLLWGLDWWFLVIWVFCFLVTETVGSDSSKEQQLSDWQQMKIKTWKKPVAFSNRQMKWALAFDSAEYELKCQCRSSYNFSCFLLLSICLTFESQSLTSVQKINPWRSFKNSEGHLTSLTSVLKVFPEPSKTLLPIWIKKYIQMHNKKKIQPFNLFPLLWLVFSNPTKLLALFYVTPHEYI